MKTMVMWIKQISQNTVYYHSCKIVLCINPRCAGMITCPHDGAFGSPLLRHLTPSTAQIHQTLLRRNGNPKPTRNWLQRGPEGPQNIPYCTDYLQSRVTHQFGKLGLGVESPKSEPTTSSTRQNLPSIRYQHKVLLQKSELAPGPLTYGENKTPWSILWVA